MTQRVRILVPFEDGFLMELMYRENGGNELPGTKRFPGGGMNKDEMPIPAARRELYEEFQYWVWAEELTYLMRFDDKIHTVLLRRHALVPGEYKDLDSGEKIILVKGTREDEKLTELTKEILKVV